MEIVSHKFTALLGKEACVFDPELLDQYCRNVSQVSRKILGILYPNSTSQVKDIVDLANLHKLPLYPVSSGKNWGLGSKAPVRNNCLVVDLSKMNRILEVNTTHGYALIEAGVTQAQLYEYLVNNKLPFIFNVIGSGKDTSLIGNALDRGVGYFSSRAENLSGMEVVLGNGELVYTGFRHYPQAKTSFLYPHGVGPEIDGLFFQSGMGIVTSAAVELIPACETHAALMFQLNNPEKLEAFIDNLAWLRKQNLITTCMHIAHRERTKISLEPLIAQYLTENRGYKPEIAKEEASRYFEKETGNEWSAIAGIMGTKQQVAMIQKIASKRMKSLGKVMLITDGLVKWGLKVSQWFNFIPWFDRKQVLLQSIKAVYGYCKGIPTDDSLHSIYWPLKMTPENFRQPDQSHAGLLYTLPVIPLDGQSLRLTADVAFEVFKKYGFIPYMTFNIINSRSLESVINLAFDRQDPEMIRKAHACIEEVNERYIRMGFIPYRVGIYNMHQLTDKDDTFWKTSSAIKKALDPNSIISPGRYEPESD